MRKEKPVAIIECTGGDEVEVYCAHQQLLDPVGLLPHPDNNNMHTDEQVEMMKSMLKANGWRSVVVVSKRSHKIVAGHLRVRAAIALGMKKVPVDLQFFSSRAAEVKHLTADNELAKLSEFDPERFAETLKELEDEMGQDEFARYAFDASEFGLEDLPIGDDDDEDDEDEDIPAPPKDPTTKPGDVWLLGPHRLMCGDSTDKASVKTLMDGQRAQLAFTSPPYNAGKNIRGNFYKGNDDNMEEEAYARFLTVTTKNALAVCDFALVNLQLLESNKRALIRFQAAMIDELKDILVWNKTQYPPHINKGTFGCKWEYVFAFGKDGAGRAFPCSWQGKYPNVVETENNSKNQYADTHKAGFPVAFPLWFLDRFDFTKSVVDLFMGTGTTLIAAESRDIVAYGMEMSPAYCDVSVLRWMNHTGKQAVLESTGQSWDDVVAERGVKP